MGESDATLVYLDQEVVVVVAAYLDQELKWWPGQLHGFGLDPGGLHTALTQAGHGSRGAAHGPDTGRTWIQGGFTRP